MSIISPTVTSDANDPVWVQAVWTALANGDVGAAVSFYRWKNMFFQVHNVIDVGSVQIQGSNDNLSWIDLTAETNLRCRFLRPAVVGGNASTRRTVTLFASKTVS